MVIDTMKITKYIRNTRLTLTKMSSARLTDEVDDAGQQSLSLSKHLFQQMVNQSEHCDVTITAGDKVGNKYIFRQFQSLHLLQTGLH